MARYIDVEKIKLTANTMVDDSGEVYVALSDVRKSIALTPTADVAPRAEVAREIFREICAEIFEMFPLKVFHLIGGAYVGESFESGKERALHDVLNCIAELEKKYTEGKE